VRDLQARRGKLVRRLLAARYPDWTTPPDVAPPSRGEPLRLGIASACFYKHTDWKQMIQGWVGHLDRRRFTVIGYSLGSREDPATEQARTLCDRFVEGPRSLEGWAEAIRQDRLHALIYPEVGLHSLSGLLAGLRLAPVQSAAWGHPISTGLPTVDYFLSHARGEPAGAEGHYTETLVRLPNLSIYYEPRPPATTGETRADFRLRPEATVYLCLQPFLKYLPQYDEVFPRIARAAGDCQFVFLKGFVPEPVGRQFERRLTRAFGAAGLNAAAYVVMLPQWLAWERYQTLSGLGDVFLDSLPYSSGMSTLEAAVANDLPVVTRPGEFFRERLAYGILTTMGVTETMARDVDEYVAVAARLACDVPYRQRVAEQMARHKYRVYRDKAAIDGLASFLEDAVERHYAGQARGGDAG